MAHIDPIDELDISCLNGGFCREIAGLNHFHALEHVGIDLAKGAQNQVGRHISPSAAVPQILHMAAVLSIERVKKLIGFTVELEGQDAKTITQRSIKGRRRLHPVPGQIHLGVTVVAKCVAPHE